MKYMALLYCNFTRLHKQWSFNKLFTFRYFQRAVWFWKMNCAEKLTYKTGTRVTYKPVMVVFMTTLCFTFSIK